MKKLICAIFAVMCVACAYSQTFHTILMVNKEEPNRQTDRTAEFNNMKAFFSQLAKTLGYTNDMQTYSGQYFKSTYAIQAIDTLVVKPNDIVVFYYCGHGANWDDDEWPHMAFLDRQIGETAIYNRLRAKAADAKLILCISACCNRDSEGARREKKSYADFDPVLTKQLFTDFEGHRGYKVSSSIRGQLSWSSLQRGPYFGMALREAIGKALTGKTRPNWVYVLEDTKNITLELTEGEQMPQFKLDRW